jgi:hypothetical protein
MRLRISRSHVIPYTVIRKYLGAFNFDSLIVEKAKTGSALRDFERIYPEMLGCLLAKSFENRRGWLRRAACMFALVTRRLKRKAPQKAVKQTLARMLPEGLR